MGVTSNVPKPNFGTATEDSPLTRLGLVPRVGAAKMGATRRAKGAIEKRMVEDFLKESRWSD